MHTPTPANLHFINPSVSSLSYICWFLLDLLILCYHQKLTFLFSDYFVIQLFLAPSSSFQESQSCSVFFFSLPSSIFWSGLSVNIPQICNVLFSSHLLLFYSQHTPQVTLLSSRVLLYADDSPIYNSSLNLSPGQSSHIFNCLLIFLLCVFRPLTHAAHTVNTQHEVLSPHLFQPPSSCNSILCLHIYSANNLFNTSPNFILLFPCLFLFTEHLLAYFPFLAIGSKIYKDLHQAQFIKCLLPKNDDLCLEFQYPHKTSECGGMHLTSSTGKVRNK